MIDLSILVRARVRNLDPLPMMIIPAVSVSYATVEHDKLYTHTNWQRAFAKSGFGCFSEIDLKLDPR